MYNNSMKLEIKKIGINGEGIAYDQKKPVFVPGTFPGEVVEATISEEKAHYAHAKINRILQKAHYRRQSPSPIEEQLGHPFFGIEYEKQLTFKLDLLTEALWKYAKVKRHWVRKINPSENEFAYRNQCKLPIQERQGKLVCGLFSPNSNQFQVVHHFLTHDPEVERIRKELLAILNQHHFPAYSHKTKQGLRYIVIRCIHGISQATLITGKDTLNKCLIDDFKKIPHLHSLHQSWNTSKQSLQFFGERTKLLFGKKHLLIPFSSIYLHVSPEAFFQLNTKQAEALYHYAVSKVDPCHTLVEAYCGIGVMSLLASSKAEQVYGIELNPHAIQDAKRNAELNHLDNCHFECADAADGLYKIAKKQKIDTLLIDPPRSGLDEAMLEAILKSQPDRIIYISCNPATLAKNIAVLKWKYQILTIQAFDLFPQTPHVECLCLLSKVQK